MCFVDVYSDGGGEGRIFHGSVFDADGGPWTLTTNGASGPFVTATNTTLTGTTSGFSGPAAFSPTCANVGVGTIITIAKGQSGKQNPKVSHSITARMLNAASTKLTAARIKICTDTLISINIRDLTDTGPGPMLTSLSPSIGCGYVAGPTPDCKVLAVNFTATKKYKAESEDGKDTDRLTLLPVP